MLLQNHTHKNISTKVLPAQDEIAAVYLQLTDFEGVSSNYIQLHKSSANNNPKDDTMYQVSLGGFAKEYAGTTWSYRIIVREISGDDTNPSLTASTATSAPTPTPILANKIIENVFFIYLLC